jgi:hypothetical protein
MVNRDTQILDRMIPGSDGGLVIGVIVRPPDQSRPNILMFDRE